MRFSSTTVSPFVSGSTVFGAKGTAEEEGVEDVGVDAAGVRLA